MPVGRKMQNIECVVFYRKTHNFQMVIIVPPLQTCFKQILKGRNKFCSSNISYVSDLLKQGRDKRDFMGGISTIEHLS